MTLIVAIACKDGIVMASDTASTDTDSGTKLTCDKIRKLGEHPILYGCSGDVGLSQKIQESLAGFKPQHNLKRTRQALRQLIVPELKEAVALHAPYPQAPYHLPPDSVLLFAGVLEKQPWILEIERDGRDTHYDDSFGNFAAIGSGKPWAQAAFRLHRRTDRDVKLGVVFAHRIVEDSIEIAAAYLAKPIHIYTMNLDGEVTKIDADEVKRLEDTCETWRALEREAVGKLLAPEPKEQVEPQIPKPA